MPTYSLWCPECQLCRRDLFCSIKDREELRCEKCEGPLETDYSRMSSGPGFALKGANWPGKEGKIERQIVKNEL